jgi:hypothetical protein
MLPAFASNADFHDAAIYAQCPGYKQWDLARKAADNSKKSTSHIPITDPALRKQILTMAAKDQRLRSALMRLLKHPESKRLEEAGNKVDAVDARNLATLKPIIAKNGFPTAAMVGRDGVRAAWMLVQHADSDPAFQQTVLGLLPPLVKSGDVSAADDALLTDRVLLAQKLPQRYGSQFETRDGVSRPRVVEDPPRLDERRKSMHLSPIADYACALGVMYGTPSQPQPWDSLTNGPDTGP